ncbi:MAG: polysaccharide deacetylase family protein [Fibrobacterota bacterium]
MKFCKCMVAVMAAVSFLAAEVPLTQPQPLPAEFAPQAPVDDPPMLIVLGSDDNTSAEGMDWIISYLEDRTHDDGTDLRMSFYANTHMGSDSWEDNPELVEQMTRAYQNGHEVSSHTATHPHFVDGPAWIIEDGDTIGRNEDQVRFSREEIREEIEQNIEALESAGIPREHMRGFRTPYLAFSDSVFTVAKELGFEYDCSVTESQGNPVAHRWPYDMADGIIDGSDESWWITTHETPVRNHPGLWQLPSYSLQAHPDDWAYLEGLASWNTEGLVTGLDWNMWAEPEGGVEFNKDQSVRALKYTLDEKMSGTRAPMAFGMHSQYYAEGGSSFPNIDGHMEKRAIIEEFIDYALQQDNVWFVNGAQVIEYMKDPVPASEFNPDDYAWSLDDEENPPTDIRLSDTTVEEGSREVGSITIIDNPGSSHTTEITSGPFTIDGNLLLADEGLAVGEYDVSIKATNQHDLSLEKTFTVEVTVAAEYTEVLEDLGWEMSTDEFEVGSEGTVENAGETPVTFSMTQGVSNPDEDEWAWASASSWLPNESTLDGVTEIELTYTADESFQVGLGTEDYGYKAVMSAGEDETVRLSPADDFEKVWGEEELNLADITGVNIGTEVEGSVNVELSSVKLFNYGGTPVISDGGSVSQSSIQLNRLTRSGLTLNVAQRGNYEIALFSPQGRMIQSINTDLSAGSNSLRFDSDLSRNMVIIRVTGAGASSVSRHTLR